MKKNLYLILLVLLSHTAFPQPPVLQVTAYTPASTGYYFLSAYTFSGFPYFPPGTQTQLILDSKGNVVYYHPVSGYFAGDFKIQPNGMMSYCGDSAFYLMDSSFNVVDTIRIVGSNYDFDLHDLQILPNGHYLLLGKENVQRDLSHNFIFMGNHSPGSSNATVVAGIVQELDQNKNVVFEWHSIDHFNIDDADEYFMSDPNYVDWTHMNAVEMDSDGNILISSRHFSEVTKINRSDSSILWRMGGKANQFTFLNDPDMFLSQHDIRRNYDGTYSIFDNGRDTTPFHPAYSKFYTIDVSNHEVSLVRSHREGPSIVSFSQGNTQLLPNGNVLTSYGDLFPTRKVFNVTDSADNKVFEIFFPDSQITYRTFNYLSLPWSLRQPTITCFQDSSGQFYLETDSLYSAYLWSTGDTTPIIPVHATDTFYAYVPKGNGGGFIRTESFVVTDLLNPCGTANITSLSDNFFQVYPVPSSGELNIRFNTSAVRPVIIYDNAGRRVMNFISREAEIKIDTQFLKPGFYFLRSGSFTRKFLVM